MWIILDWLVVWESRGERAREIERYRNLESCREVDNEGLGLFFLKFSFLFLIRVWKRGENEIESFGLSFFYDEVGFGFSTWKREKIEMIFIFVYFYGKYGLISILELV